MCAYTARAWWSICCLNLSFINRENPKSRKHDLTKTRTNTHSHTSIEVANKHAHKPICLAWTLEGWHQQLIPKLWLRETKDASRVVHFSVIHGWYRPWIKCSTTLFLFFLSFFFCLSLTSISLAQSTRYLRHVNRQAKPAFCASSTELPARWGCCVGSCPALWKHSQTETEHGQRDRERQPKERQRDRDSSREREREREREGGRARAKKSKKESKFVLRELLRNPLCS